MNTTMSTENTDGGTIECGYCGKSFDGEEDLHWHWYVDHEGDERLTDEQHLAARAEHRSRLLDAVDTDVTVTIPEDVWTDLVELEFDGDVDPETVTPADVSADTLLDVVETEYHWKVEGRAD